MGVCMDHELMGVDVPATTDVIFESRWEPDGPGVAQSREGYRAACEDCADMYVVGTVVDRKILQDESSYTLTVVGKEGARRHG